MALLCACHCPAVPSSFELEKIYDALVNLLLKMPSYRFVDPQLVDGVVSAALLVLREMLYAHPVPDPGFLECVVPCLIVLVTSWAQPIGGLAAVVLDMVCRECLSPGWCFRR